MVCLRSIFRIIGSELSEFNNPICNMMIKLFEKVERGFVYSNILYLIESFSHYLLYTSENKESQKYITDKMVGPINKLISKQNNDISSLLIQVYAIMVRKYSDIPEDTIQAITNSILNTENYTLELVSLFPSYSIYIQELIKRDPSIIVKFNDQMMKMSKKFLEFRIDDAFFSLLKCIFDTLGESDLIESGWINFVVQASVDIINASVNDKDHLLNTRPLYFKELYLFICRFGLKYSFQRKNFFLFFRIF